jgi:hypothetical protein
MSDTRNLHEQNSCVQENNDEFYHYFATGRFAAADVYDGGNVNLNSGFLQARTVRRNAGNTMAKCAAE